MAILYRIYANDGNGSPIDYSNCIATTSDLSHTVPMLRPSSDYRFGVRAYDSATEIEEANTRTTIRILIDDQGRRIEGRPNVPHALTVRPTANGGARIAWAYHSAGQSAPPIDFRIFLAEGQSPPPLTPITLVSYRPNQAGYMTSIAGLTQGKVYTITLIAAGAGDGSASLPASTQIVGDSIPPDPVDELAVSA